ncbi:hypothetical protein ATCC27039_05240 [Actinomyces naeslundii]|nr:hypothetical protein [Actinomyces naeslundii]BDH76398.1 hypothetical protein ATCC27039_05240 [Actinomyces naeslundii]
MKNSELITADDLNSWPDNSAHDAQENFPRLIRHLLHETPGISEVSVRAGNGVSAPGYDGIAQLDKAVSVLPSGSLRFELGTNKDIGTKASKDYRKRANQNDAAGHVFVFATPRRWSGKYKWLEERRSEGKFANVWALDADDLEAWLETSPSSHYWISEHLGKQPDKARTLDQWWGSFHQATHPELPLSMFTAGRESTRDKLRELLAKAPRTITIQADWRDDCLAFIYASLAADTENQLDALDQSVIIVKSVGVWNRISRQAGKSILIPAFDGAEQQPALNNGHHVLQIVDREQIPLEKTALQLPRVSRPDVQLLLNGCGVNFQQAGYLAGLARRNMPSFVRALTRNTAIQTPTWATDTNAPMLAALTLVGAWDANNDKDKQAIAALVGSDYDTVTSLCQQRAGGNDPVMSHSGSAWRFASLEEAFRCLSSKITDGVIERWKQLALDVLGEANPSYGLNPLEKFAQQLNEPTSQVQYSEELKSGIARSLAMIGSMDGDGAQSRKLRDNAVDIANQLLNQAVGDDSGRVWNLIGPRLRYFAETAPQQFVDVVIDNLDQDSSSLLRAFNSDSSDLLWALEVLAWSEEYFDDAIECLALLAANRTDDKQRGNRSGESLSAILCGWANFTTVSSGKKLAALDSVKRMSSSVGWDLLFALWPDWTTITPTYTPRFRADWCPLTDKPVKWEERSSFFHGLVERALSWSGMTASNLERLVNHINIGVLSDDRTKIIDYLGKLSSSEEFDDDDRYLVWHTVRELAAKHSHHRAEWSLPEEEVDRLLELSDRWEPTSPVLRHLYLFDHNPGLLDCALHRDIDDYDQKVETRRQEALSEILADPQAIEDLALLASRADASLVLGWMLADRQELNFWDIAYWADSSDRKLVTVMDGYLCRSLDQRGASWLQAVLDDSRLTAAQRAAVLRCVPAEWDYWDVVARNQDDDNAYWQTAEMRVLPPDHMQYAIERLVACGRAWDAIDSVSLSIRSAKQEGVKTDLAADVLIGLLHVACTQDSVKISSLSYEVGQVLDHIVELNANQVDVARLELLLYPLIGDYREPIVLHRTLAAEPHLFVRLMEVAHRDKTMLGMDRSASFRMATSVLNGWRGCPGVTADGELDAAVMQQWVEAARQGLAAAELSDIGDYEIGRLLANSPEDENGMWPLPAVCALIDEVGSRNLDEGFIAGMCRGLMSSVRGVYDGGQQEHESAQRCHALSKQIRLTSRHTARLLKKAANRYKDRAKEEDEQALARQDAL